MAWIARLRNISIILCKLIVLHESLFELSMMSAHVAVIRPINLPHLLLILLLILLVPKAELPLVLHLHGQVHWREGRIEWLRLLRCE